MCDTARVIDKTNNDANRIPTRSFERRSTPTIPDSSSSAKRFATLRAVPEGEDRNEGNEMNEMLANRKSLRFATDANLSFSRIPARPIVHDSYCAPQEVTTGTF